MTTASEAGRPIAIFDGHNDCVHRLSDYRADGIDFLAGSDKGHLDLPRAAAGGMVGGLFAMFVRPPEPPKDDLTVTPKGYRVRLAEPIDTAYAQGEVRRQLGALKALAARSAGQVRVATSVAEIEAGRAAAAFAVVLHIEGAEAVDAGLDELERLYAEGLRSLGPVWSRPNIFGHGVPFGWPRSPDTGPGLTDAGKALVRGCNELGIMIDLSHLNEKGFWDVAALSTRPLVATHSCAHAICASTRNLTDRQLDAIRDSDGLVGVNFCVNDVRPDARAETNTPLEMLANQIDYLVARLGIERVALGSDFDGAPVPAAIGDASGLQALIAVLRERGYDDEALARIGMQNWLRVFRLSWRA